MAIDHRYSNPNYSGVWYDHAPSKNCPTARHIYMMVVMIVADQYGHGYPVDIGDIEDEKIIEAVRDFCCVIRQMKI